MWLTSSSIGRKFVMAVTGVCLVLFVTFHVLMNSVCLIWPTAYNQVCEFLGANWYALVATVGLAALFIIHIIYAVWLTVQNRRARGTSRYAVTSRPKQVEWSSKNMLVLGIVVLAFLAVHMVQFWSKMQLQELLGHDLSAWPTVNDAPVHPAFGTLLIQKAFSCWCTPVIYIIGFVALWFHMNHGFWSMFHSVGWDANRWIGRLKTIGCVWTTIVVALFVAQAIVFTVHAHNNYYTENEDLCQQYGEYWSECAEIHVEDFQCQLAAAMDGIENPYEAREAQGKFLAENGEKYLNQFKAIKDAAKKQAPNYHSSNLAQMDQLIRALEREVQRNAQSGMVAPN